MTRRAWPEAGLFGHPTRLAGCHGPTALWPTFARPSTERSSTSVSTKRSTRPVGTSTVATRACVTRLISEDEVENFHPQPTAQRPRPHLPHGLLLLLLESVALRILWRSKNFPEIILLRGNELSRPALAPRPVRSIRRWKTTKAGVMRLKRRHQERSVTSHLYLDKWCRRQNTFSSRIHSSCTTTSDHTAHIWRTDRDVCTVGLRSSAALSPIR